MGSLIINNQSYNVQRIIAEGGFAYIYLATDPENQACVLKLLKHGLLDKPDVRPRFDQEAELLSRLDHQYLIKALSPIVEYQGSVGFLLDYLPNSLSLLLHRGAKWPIAENLQLIIKVLDCLEYLHGRGIIHRDVKPGNILFARPGIGEPRLADLGAAKVKGEESFTKPGQIVGEGSKQHLVYIGDEEGVILTYCLGSPLYLAPEYKYKLVCHSGIDVFSAGAILYRLLTGQDLIQQEKQGKNIRFQYCFQDPRKLNPEISPYLFEAIEWACNKHPQRPTAKELRGLLQEVLRQDY